MGFKDQNIISVEQFSKQDILHLVNVAEKMKTAYNSQLLSGKILATLFFEPSTRTRLSFDAAMKKLGGQVVGFSDWRDTSILKGEDLTDTIKVINGYSDAIVIRHPENGSAQLAAEASIIPVINGGDGNNQHPTQTFVDLFTIFTNQGSLDNMSIGFMGDLKYGRTVHSLVKALNLFNVDFYFISPKELELPDEVKKGLNKKNIKEETQNLYDVASKLDVLYATRIQKERFLAGEDYTKISKSYRLGKEFLEKTKERTKIMHPLPRVGELQHELDNSKQALYFQQAHNGVPVRMALLSLIFGHA